VVTVLSPVLTGAPTVSAGSTNGHFDLLLPTRSGHGVTHVINTVSGNPRLVTDGFSQNWKEHTIDNPLTQVEV